MAILTIHDFVKRLQQAAGTIQADCAQKTLKGISDPNEYWKVVGRSQGAAEMADVAYQIMKRADMDDDDGGLPEMPPDDPPPKKPGRRS